MIPPILPNVPIPEGSVSPKNRIRGEADQDVGYPIPHQPTEHVPVGLCGYLHNIADAPAYIVFTACSIDDSEPAAFKLFNAVDSSVEYDALFIKQRRQM